MIAGLGWYTYLIERQPKKKNLIKKGIGVCFALRLKNILAF